MVKGGTARGLGAWRTRHACNDVLLTPGSGYRMRADCSLHTRDLFVISTSWLTCGIPWALPPPQALYERACEYLELDTRAEVLNARFEVRNGDRGWFDGA